MKYVSMYAAALVCSLHNFAHATLINFDELNQESYVTGTDEGLRPLSNEYESQGVIFSSSAYLITGQDYSLPLSQQSHVSGPGFSFDFVGELPKYVSVIISNASGYATNVNAFGPNNFHSYTLTSGTISGMTDDEGTPYIPNQLIAGISSISLSGQAGVSMDNLTFTSTVPEPSALILFGIGIFGFVLRHLKIAGKTADKCNAI